jgi:hypothetical protein
MTWTLRKDKNKLTTLRFVSYTMQRPNKWGMWRSVQDCDLTTTPAAWMSCNVVSTYNENFGPLPPSGSETRFQLFGSNFVAANLMEILRDWCTNFTLTFCCLLRFIYPCLCHQSSRRRRAFRNIKHGHLFLAGLREFASTEKWRQMTQQCCYAYVSSMSIAQETSLHFCFGCNQKELESYRGLGFLPFVSFLIS